jgi:hypothetical protein
MEIIYINNIYQTMHSILKSMQLVSITCMHKQENLLPWMVLFKEISWVNKKDSLLY